MSFFRTRISLLSGYTPASPEHILILPRTHIASIADVTEKQQDLLGRLFLVAKEVAGKEGISARGFVDCELWTDGGQLVPHLHFHLLGVADSMTRWARDSRLTPLF